MALPKIPHSSRPITTRMAGRIVDAGQTEAEGCSHNHFGDDMNMLSIRDNLNMLPTQYTKRLPAAWLQRSITLPNDVEEVPQLAAFVDEVCEAVGFDMSLTMSLNLAIEEAVVNVMEYAYPEEPKATYTSRRRRTTSAWSSSLATAERPSTRRRKKTPTSRCRPKNDLSADWASTWSGKSWTASTMSARTGRTC